MFRRLLLPILVLVLGLGNAEVVIHETKLGRISGVLGESSPNLLPFVSFHSIPFANAPVGKLRFRDPVALVDANWGPEIRDGTKPPPVCPQWSWKNRDSLQVKVRLYY